MRGILDTIVLEAQNLLEAQKSGTETTWGEWGTCQNLSVVPLQSTDTVSSSPFFSFLSHRNFSLSLLCPFFHSILFSFHRSSIAVRFLFFVLSILPVSLLPVCAFACCIFFSSSFKGIDQFDQKVYTVYICCVLYSIGPFD